MPVLNDSSLTVMDFALARDAEDNLAFIWQDLSDEGADIFYSIYDEEQGLWSQSLQLTADLPMDKMMAPAFAANGDLVVAYNKTEITFEDREVEIEGGETITVEQVPTFGRDDLYVLRHTLGRDLTIAAEDLGIWPENPSPGAAATISATVHNLGDLTATDVRVALYDGDPDAGGVRIGATQVVGTLAGGASGTVYFPWTVPAGDQAHWIYARVDVGDYIVEWDEANNTASFAAILPDLWVGSTLATPQEGEQFELAARIENSGSATSEPTTVEFRRDAITGTLLSAVLLYPIPAGEGQALTTLMDASALPAGSHRVYVVADTRDVIVEADEENNAGYVTVNVLPDLTVDAGDIWFSGTSDFEYGLHVTVRNIGKRTAYDVLVSMGFGNPLEETTRLIAEKQIAEIPPGGETTLDILWWGVHGDDDLYVLVDGDGAIAEMDESNNMAARRNDTLPDTGRMTLPLVLSSHVSGQAHPTPAPAPTASPTPTATRPTSPTDTPTPIPTPTPTSRPTATPTPTLTPTPTRTPSATPAPMVALDGVGVTDDDDQLRMAFALGDTARFWLRVRNREANPVEADASWEVRDAAGSRVDALSWGGTRTFEPGLSNWRLEREIPADLPIDHYTFTGSITYAGSTTSARLWLPPAAPCRCVRKAV